METISNISSQSYYCEKCNYKTTRKGNYIKQCGHHPDAGHLWGLAQNVHVLSWGEISD